MRVGDIRSWGAELGIRWRPLGPPEHPDLPNTKIGNKILSPKRARPHLTEPHPKDANPPNVFKIDRESDKGQAL